ncbi:MAG TPA: hypothetical protein VMG41_07235 [Gemmatimonadales bacterium]|nr:hypothetical protein [Gemmatimonadales bacterium]
MSDENPRVTVRESWRWMALALLFLGLLGAYFVYSPRVPPVINPAQNTE